MGKIISAVLFWNRSLKIITDAWNPTEESELPYAEETMSLSPFNNNDDMGHPDVSFG